MSKVTSKLQVSIPKALAQRYAIEPGDELEWQPAGDVLRVVPSSHHQASGISVVERLRLFDRATVRQQARDAQRALQAQHTKERGWTRDDLYKRS